jgi:hypothetical protein
MNEWMCAGMHSELLVGFFAEVEPLLYIHTVTILMTVDRVWIGNKIY